MANCKLSFLVAACSPHLTSLGFGKVLTTGSQFCPDGSDRVLPDLREIPWASWGWRCSAGQGADSPQPPSRARRGREMAGARRVSAQRTSCSTDETRLEGMLELILFVSTMVFPGQETDVATASSLRCGPTTDCALQSPGRWWLKIKCDKLYQ